MGALVAPACAEAVNADAHWPQWRGPLNSGASPAADPPTKWSETENVKWKVKLPGEGNSTPIVWGQKVFLQAAIPAGGRPAATAETGQARVEFVLQQQAPRGRGGRGGFGGGPAPAEAYRFVLMCLDRETGKTLWQAVAREEVPHEGHHRDGSFSAYSPVTDGTHVWAYFGSRGLHCFDMDGKLVWSKDLGRMQSKMSFGEGSSPALFGDTIVINWDHEGDDFVVALDKNTGNERWRQPRNEDTSWATPLVVEHEGRAQVVTCASSKVRSYDLQTGKLLWEVGPLTANVIPSPVAGGGMVFATSGFRGAALYAVRLGSTGDLKGTDAIAWSRDKGTPYVPSPLLYDGKLYYYSGNSNVLTCLEATTGKTLFDARRVDDLEGGAYASPVGAGGRVYLVGRGGTAVVIKNSGRFEVLATNVLEERFDASPAVAGKELFLRGKQSLYCIAAK
jgi:outer membrane protein assembly factor BamB